MASRRRWLQFSLRTAFVVLTVGCIWLGWKVERARQQREAVEEIEAADGMLNYNWEHFDFTHPGPSGPAWLRRLTGDDFFQHVEEVNLQLLFQEDNTILMLIPKLQHLPGLKLVVVSPMDKNTLNKLTAALPECEVVTKKAFKGYVKKH